MQESKVKKSTPSKRATSVDLEHKVEALTQQVQALEEEVRYLRQQIEGTNVNDLFGGYYFPNLKKRIEMYAEETPPE